MKNENKNIYNELFQMLSSPNDPINFEDIFPLITEYAECRKKDMRLNIPINIFLRYPYTETIGDGFRITAKRINPITKDSYDAEEWGYFTSAFSNDNGIFVDINATDNLQKTDSINGFWKTKNLVDFIYTLEHELMHAFRDQSLVEGQATKENMQVLKEQLVLTYLDLSSELSEKFFYYNAHNELFCEEEANKHANDYVNEQIIKYQLEKTPPFDNHTVTGLIEERVNISNVKKDSKAFNFSRPDIDGFIINEEFNTTPKNIVSYLMDYVVYTNTILIEKYPMLYIEYNEDGTKKTYSEIEEFRYKLFSIPGITINGVKTERDDLLKLCDFIIENSPLLLLEKMEQQLGKDLYDTKEDSKERLLNEGIESIEKIIESENFFPINALTYLEQRNTEIDEKYNPESRESYRIVFESVKVKLESKIYKSQNEIISK